MKELTKEEENNLFDISIFALDKVDEKDFNKALLDLGAYYSCHITKESIEKYADELISFYEGLIDNTDSIKEKLLWNYDSAFRIGSLTQLCLLMRCDGDQIDSFLEDITSICGANSEDLTYEHYYDFTTGKDHYKQKNKKIYRVEESKDGEIETLKAIFSVNKITRFTDVLGVSEPLYTFEYYDGFNGELKTIEFANTEQIVNRLYDDDLFDTDLREAEKIFRSIRHTLHNDCLMEKQDIIAYTGFFMSDDNKLISNTNIDNLLTSPSDLKEALMLLIGLLKSNPHSQYENSAVIRKALSMPFHYCLKQLGFAEDNTNGVILYGTAKTGKTSICKISLWFYGEKPYDYNASTDTLASLVRRLSTTTFFTLLDDSYGLLNNPAVQNTIKKGMYEKYSRTVADRDSRGDVLEYLALSTPIFTYNENIPIIDDGLERRLDKIHYDKNKVISKKDSIEFKMKYNPLNKDSILEKLQYIGIAFRDWITPYLESNAKELNDIDSLTIQFFSEILSAFDLDYAPLTTPYEYEANVEDYATIIKNSFNNKLQKSRQQSYSGFTLQNIVNIAGSGFFNWLGYQPKKRQFVIKTKEFVKECNKITNHSFSFDDLMSEFEISNYKIEKQMKVNGKNLQATRISEDDLIYNILNINHLVNEPVQDDESDDDEASSSE